MFHPGGTDEKAALIFDDLASAIDAGLPLETIGGNPSLGDRVLIDLAKRRGIKLRPTDKTVLEAAWKSGKGAIALRGRAENRRRRADFQGEIWAGLRYPLSLLVMLPIAATATMAFIGPGMLIALGVIYLIVGLAAWVLIRKVRHGDARIERYPVLGPLLEDLRELPYLESLHSLYGAGIAIVQAHETAVRSVRMPGLRKQLAVAHELLAQGSSLQEALSQSGALGTETRTLLATGEQAGQLEDALHRALIRRQDIASRKLSTAAKRLGQITYGLAVIGIVTILYKFYGAYFTAIGRL